MNKTYLLFVEELRGFVKSWVMIVLLIGLPMMSLLAYYLATADKGGGMPAGRSMPVSYFIALMVASTGGTLAGVMIGANIVTEKTRRVYDLFLIRPLGRGSILLAKFFSVLICVTIACILALALGIAIDAFGEKGFSPMMWENSLEAAVMTFNTVAVSTAGGILVGVISPSVLIAVLLVMYGSQNLVLIPILPSMVGLPDLLWITTLASLGLTAGLLWLSTVIFKRKEF